VCVRQWENLIEGQNNLRDAVRGTITFATPAKEYALDRSKPLATLFVRPRGIHLDEAHIQVGQSQGPGTQLRLPQMHGLLLGRHLAGRVAPSMLNSPATQCHASP
jgi:hypothetical protein